MPPRAKKGKGVTELMYYNGAIIDDDDYRKRITFILHSMDNQEF